MECTSYAPQSHSPRSIRSDFFSRKARATYAIYRCVTFDQIARLDDILQFKKDQNARLNQFLNARLVRDRRVQEIPKERGLCQWSFL
jgi:hypothetical protein